MELRAIDSMLRSSDSLKEANIPEPGVCARLGMFVLTVVRHEEGDDCLSRDHARTT